MSEPTVDTTAEAAPAEEAANEAPAPAAEAAPAAAEAQVPEAGLDGADDKAAEQAPAPEEKSASEWLGAPEGNYTDEGIELPEGFVSDKTTLAGLAEICGDFGLSQKAFANIVNRMTPVLAQAQNDQLQAFRKENLSAAYADKELGGAKWQETMAAANAAYKKYTTPALRALLEQSGLNTHPDMIRLFRNIGAQVSDDAVVRGAPSAKSNPLAGFYDHSNMN